MVINKRSPKSHYNWWLVGREIENFYRKKIIVNDIVQKIPLHKKYNLKLSIEIYTPVVNAIKDPKTFYIVNPTFSSRPNKVIKFTFKIETISSYMYNNINKKRKFWPNILISIFTSDSKFGKRVRYIYKYINPWKEMEKIESIIENFILNYEY